MAEVAAIPEPKSDCLNAVVAPSPELNENAVGTLKARSNNNMGRMPMAIRPFLLFVHDAQEKFGIYA